MTANRHGSAVIEFPSDLEIVITREFDAPIELVFDVLTKPEHVSKWFAPFDCEMKECSIDLRVGGNYHQVFVTQDGTECSFRGTYLEGPAAGPDRRDVAVRRVARCGGCRVRGSARNSRSDEADNDADVLRRGWPCPYDQVRRPGGQLRQDGGLPEVIARSKGNAAKARPVSGRLMTKGGDWCGSCVGAVGRW